MNFEEPMALYNPKDTAVEWMVDRKVYTLGPKETKVFDWFVADMALKFSDTGLEKYIPNTGQEVKESSGLEKLPWKKLVSMASKEGIFKPGMSKETLMEELNKRGQGK